MLSFKKNKMNWKKRKKIFVVQLYNHLKLDTFSGGDFSVVG